MRRPRPSTGRRSAIAVALATIGLVAVAATQAVSAKPAPDPVIVAVGDIACQSLSKGTGEGACRSDETAALIKSLSPTRFLALGDLQYNNGTLEEYQRVFDVQFGSLRSITAPAPGNHEYGTPGAQGYFDYWGPIANPTLGYYSFNLGSWHIVSLNSDICGDPPGCGPGTPQYEWLAADLKKSASATCTLAFQHHPRYDWRPWQDWVDDDGKTHNAGTETAPYIEMWRLMDGAGVDVMLVGHNHLYQRWAPQDADGNATPSGIRQFTVGTGGRSLYPLGKDPKPANLERTQNKAFGVLKMTLHATSYDYQWVPLRGEPAFQDKATASCA